MAAAPPCIAANRALTTTTSPSGSRSAAANSRPRIADETERREVAGVHAHYPHRRLGWRVVDCDQPQRRAAERRRRGHGGRGELAAPAQAGEIPRVERRALLGGRVGRAGHAICGRDHAVGRDDLIGIATARRPLRRGARRRRAASTSAPSRRRRGRQSNAGAGGRGGPTAAGHMAEAGSGESPRRCEAPIRTATAEAATASRVTRPSTPNCTHGGSPAPDSVRANQTSASAAPPRPAGAGHRR